MSDCGCDKALSDLEEYLRNEKCHTEYQEISEHLAHCSGCQSEAHIARTLTDAVARACAEKAPDDLRDQVLARIRASVPE